MFDMQAKNRFIARLSVFTLVLLFLGGCATKDLVNKADDLAAKQFAPAADKSNIYIVRKSGIRGQAIHMSVSLDREVVGAIQNKTYVMLEVEPGAHRLEIGNSVKSKLPYVDFLHPVRIKLETVPGRNYFVIGNMTMGRPNVALVPEEEGKSTLSKGNYRRVARLR